MPAKSHGLSKTRTHGVWLHIKSRCLLPTNAAYDRYGGRGIKICDRWRESFEAFLEDMGLAPEGMELDRINNNGHYEPGNCRWATTQQQANNRRSNRLITFNGKTQTLMQWAREIGIKRSTIQMRLDAYGWSLEKTMTTPTIRWK